MSPVPCSLSTMMLCLLKLMKHTVIWSLLLYWRHSTWLGKWEFHSFPKSWSWKISNWECCSIKKVKIAYTRLLSVWFRSWSRFLAVSLQVPWVINPVKGCRYFLPGLQLHPQPLRGLLSIFAAWWKEAPWVLTLPKTVTRQYRSCDLNPGPTAPESSTLATRLPSHHKTVAAVWSSVRMSFVVSNYRTDMI